MLDYEEEENAKKKLIEDRDKRRKDQELSDLKKVLSFVEGRRLMWRVLDEAGVFRSTFNSNALNMAFMEGNRNIGLVLFNEILKASPNSFTQMQREYISDKKSEINGDKKQ